MSAPSKSGGAQTYYEDYWSEQGFAPSGVLDDAVRDALERHVPPETDVLDVGCGDGRAVGLWARGRGNPYVGVDVSGTAVARARELGLHVQQIDDAAELPFETGSVGAVTCLEVFEHLFEPQLAAAEIARVLRAGGVLVATVPNVAYWRRRADLALLGRWNPYGDDRAIQEPWRDPHLRFFSPRTFARMLEANGFDEVSADGFGQSLLSEIPLVRRLNPSRRAGRLSRGLASGLPSLFGQRVLAVARRAA